MRIVVFVALLGVVVIGATLYQPRLSSDHTEILTIELRGQPSTRGTPQKAKTATPKEQDARAASRRAHRPSVAPARRTARRDAGAAFALAPTPARAGSIRRDEEGADDDSAPLLPEEAES